MVFIVLPLCGIDGATQIPVYQSNKSPKQGGRADVTTQPPFPLSLHILLSVGLLFPLFLCVVMIPSGFRGGVGVSFFSVNGSLLSLGNVCFAVIGKGISRNRKIPLVCRLFGFTMRSRRLVPFSSPGIPAL